MTTTPIISHKLSTGVNRYYSDQYVYVRQNNFGYGLFAKQKLDIKIKIGPYAGQILDKNAALIEQELKNNYLFIAKDSIIDARDCTKSTALRYVNKVENVNESNSKWVLLNGEVHLEITKEIRSDVEILAYYGTKKNVNNYINSSISQKCILTALSNNSIQRNEFINVEIARREFEENNINLNAKIRYLEDALRNIYRVANYSKERFGFLITSERPINLEIAAGESRNITINRDNKKRKRLSVSLPDPKNPEYGVKDYTKNGLGMVIGYHKHIAKRFTKKSLTREDKLSLAEKFSKYGIAAIRKNNVMESSSNYQTIDGDESDNDLSDVDSKPEKRLCIS
jgi:hypothetical protein